MESDINEIIIHYLDDSITSNERISFLQWLKNSEANRTYFYEVRDLWLACHAQYATDLDTEIALARFKEQVSLIKLKSERNTWKRKIPAYYLAWTAVASILLLIGIYFFRDGTTINQPIINNLFTAEGSKGKFILPDSSVVWLNSGSSLRYVGDLSDCRRVVSLSGEAYFEVAKNERPFIVKTGELDIEVLGTRFNVRAYDEFPVISTTLIEGSVKILKGCSPTEIEETILKPGQQLRYNKDDDKMELANVNTHLYIAWRDGKMIFDQERIEDAFALMEQNSNMVIVLKNKNIAGRKITGSFSFDEKPEKMFTVLQQSIPFDFYTRNDTIFIE